MKYEANFEELDNLTKFGMLSKKETDQLVLYNYTDACTYSKCWNEHTLNSRGTIYEKSSGKVVGYSFKKFFNLSELDPNSQQSILNSTNFKVYEKMDGSLGTVYYYDNQWKVATRGSFSSDQAIYATEKLLPKYDLAKLDTSNSYIVEIIYPENRIIVDYGDTEELVLLACFRTSDGADIDISTIDSPFRKCPEMEFKTIEAVIEHTSKLEGKYNEGFVIKLANGVRVKIKSPDYLRIARIVSRLSPLVLWENMKDGKVSEQLMMSIPEEFFNQYDDMRYELETQYAEIQQHCRDLFLNVLKNGNINGMVEGKEAEAIEKKKLALYLANNPNELNGACFLIWNNKPLEPFIMKLIRPTGNILKE